MIEVLQHQVAHRGTGFGRSACHVRQQDHVVTVQQRCRNVRFLGEGIVSGAGNLAGF